MAHWSEDSQKLTTDKLDIKNLEEFAKLDKDYANVFLLWFPFPRESVDIKKTQVVFKEIANYCAKLDKKSIICFLTTPSDAASLLENLQDTLYFQLWIAVKTSADAYFHEPGSLPKRHTALLVFTKDSQNLIHTKTRIKYTYCPSCNKTTKDYGGKKHTYHEYGTLISDVWRDIEINPKNSIDILVDRLCDLFGKEPYQKLYWLDMRTISELQPVKKEIVEETNECKKLNFPDIKYFENKLLNEDCLSALQALPDNCIDFCFADPPYNLDKKYDNWNDNIKLIEYFTWCDRWLSELYRVLKPGCTLAVLNIPQWAARYYQYLNSLMMFQDWIAWDALSFPVRMIMPAHYTILCFSKGSPRPLPGLYEKINVTEELFLNPLAEWYCLRSSCIKKRNKFRNIDRSSITNIWYDIHRLKHNSRRVDHPCQLPPDLMRRLFALYTNPDEIILDCFNGAGTSTLVAHQMQRRFIGIELSQHYHQIALNRHEQLEKGIDPFGKLDKVPLAKNSSVQRLPKQKYQVSKKTLQLEIKRIATEIGHIPTKQEVKQLSKYPIEYFENYFNSWGEACAAARTTGMTEIQTLVQQLGSI